MQKRIEAKSILEIKIVILRTIVRSIAWLAKFYQHSDLKRLRNKCAMTCFAKKVLSLGRESKRSSETSYACERGLSHELINFEPSPEFLSSLQLTKKFNPLTKREGNNSTDTIYSLFTTHYSLIHNDMDFLRFTFHFSRKAAFGK